MILKLTPPPPPPPPPSSQEFRNEVRVLAKLRHPNITNFYGVTAAPDHLIVTELLHGSLYRLLHFQSIPLSLGLKIRIAKDIACGAAYIHGLNPSIVHRDINSSNVLVTGDLEMLQRIVDENRSEPVAKLSDFGLSRSVERFMTQCTGNAYYLAPGEVEEEELALVGVTMICDMSKGSSSSSSSYYYYYYYYY